MSRYLILCTTVSGCLLVLCLTVVLGINFDVSLSWSVYIATIATKASKRLYFLKQLKKAGVSPQQLLHFYVTVIRPVLEYCTPLWHCAITHLGLNSWSRYKSTLFTLFILLLGTCHILTYCSSLNLPPLNPDVTNFQGHSLKVSLAYPLPCVIYFPLHVIRLSCLGSEQPHGSHTLYHAPKNIVPSLIVL